MFESTGILAILNKYSHTISKGSAWSAEPFYHAVSQVQLPIANRTSGSSCFFRLMTPDQQKALFGNTARAMAGVPEEIQIRHIKNCAKADPAYGKGVAEALGIDPAKAGL